MARPESISFSPGPARNLQCAEAFLVGDTCCSWTGLSEL